MSPSTLCPANSSASFPPSTKIARAERAALNQSILVPIVPSNTLADNTSAVTAPNTGDQTVANVSMTISKSKHAPIRWNGEEQRGLLNAGSYAGILKNQFTQAFRAICNQVETIWRSRPIRAARAPSAPPALRRSAPRPICLTSLAS
jgi:hypothetical protein